MITITDTFNIVDDHDDRVHQLTDEQIEKLLNWAAPRQDPKAREKEIRKKLGFERTEKKIDVWLEGREESLGSKPTQNTHLRQTLYLGDKLRLTLPRDAGVAEFKVEQQHLEGIPGAVVWCTPFYTNDQKQRVQDVLRKARRA